ncbi:GntR family transcriptional regulator [Devosia sp. YIM 151766]|uniref:GntR family transcriptional regulator n=1 Tax=Devosia sp. YIM 151766 TaxID=3017325 RepID=UPI00255CCEB3|nr:GntR family transcriptional regulator [Devosia sp. YIM 151766]WIY52242.1 GntR family transcriptional regulator [Devosia sp. YIM 151766]
MKLTRPKSLKEMVVDELRERIIDDRLNLGASLSENTLAADMGLSKTPVREALQQLQLEGLVEVMAQKGTFVVRIGAEDVLQISELRKVLELAAIQLAIERNHEALVDIMSEIMVGMQLAYDTKDMVSYQKLDGQYHQAFIDLCGNKYLRDAYSQIAARTQALRSRLSRLTELNSRSIVQHHKVLGAIRTKDIPALLKELELHIEETKVAYLEVLEHGAMSERETETP